MQGRELRRLQSSAQALQRSRSKGPPWEACPWQVGDVLCPSDKAEDGKPAKPAALSTE